MKDKKIYIGKPYILKKVNDILVNGCRLCADITMPNPNTGLLETRTCFFEVQDEYGTYLCYERSEAFVSGLLCSALELGCDIEFEAPVSERFYYQIKEYFIPMFTKYNTHLVTKNVSIFGNRESSLVKTLGIAATGCAGGVDSFHTIIEHAEENMDAEGYRLTHVIYTNLDTQDTDEDRIKGVFLKKLPEMKGIAKELGCNCIALYSNLYEFYKYPYKGWTWVFTCNYATIPYSLMKLIGKYYVSSGDPIESFNLDLRKTQGHDASVFDIFTTSCLNTESLTFYSSGMKCSRLEKTAILADNTVVQKYLTVCSIEASGINKNDYTNCSKCPKCLRTMTQLYTMKKLDKFATVFNVKEFYKHKNRYIGEMIGKNKHSYVSNALKCAKENNVQIGVVPFLYAYGFYIPLMKIHKLLSNNKLARIVYFTLKMDRKFDRFRNKL